MSSRLKSLLFASLLAAVVLIGAVCQAEAASTWKLEQPDPPDGAPFKVPLGAPGDIEFYDASHGLMSVEGNSTIARGLYFYDGQKWKQLSTVCGGSSETSRIAWAGPTEFWTVTEPSKPRSGQGLALCHFKDGRVIGSFSTIETSSDPFRVMDSAACSAPDNCWFGGIGSEDATGERIGAFHLHWDGTSLKTFYNPQGRGVSDMTASGGSIFESSFVGPGPGNQAEPELATPEGGGPLLVHKVAPNSFPSEPYVIPPATPATDDAELLSISGDSDGDLWTAGGGTASGPDAPPDGWVARPPAVARRLPGGSWQNIDLSGAGFKPNDRIVAIAPIPGSPDAMAAVVAATDSGSTTAKARVARITPGGAVTFTTLPTSGAGRGSASKLACPAPEECWLTTQAGWVFHFTDGTTHPQTTDPAFASVLTFRPNESAEQFVPDAPPVDDSQLFAPPPATDNSAIAGGTTRLKAALKSVKSKLKGTTLTISFKTRRRVRVQVLAKKGGKTIARSKYRWFAANKKGKLSVKLNPANWPKKLRFRISDPSAPKTTDGGSAELPDSTDGGPTNANSVTT